MTRGVLHPGVDIMGVWKEEEEEKDGNLLNFHGLKDKWNVIVKLSSYVK